MNHLYRQEEFEIIVDRNGSMRIPASVKCRLRPGKRYTVRMSEGGVHDKLRRRGITENEIEIIARRQLEPRENVVRFLQSEGAMAGDPRLARILRKRGR